jgi:hypothetical protein
MSKRNRTPASANEVRQWGVENGHDVPAPREGETFARGRISKSLVEAFETANPGREYVAGHKPERTFTLTVTKQDKRGRKYSRKVEKTLSQVRELAGLASNAKGLPSAESIAAAEAALSEV